MKKTILASILLVFIASTAVIAQEPARNFQYDLNAEGNGIVIKQYIGSNPRLVIPGRIEGYPVIQIGETSPDSRATILTATMIAPKDFLVSLVIPEGVRIIGYSALRNQGNLTSVTFPSTLKVIGGWAFENSGLRTIRLPDSVEEIYRYAFSDSINLTDANIPAGIKRIGTSAFRGCRMLSNLAIPAGIRSIVWVTSLSNSAFRGTALTIAARRRLVELGYPNDEF